MSDEVNSDQKPVTDEEVREWREYRRQWNVSQPYWALCAFGNRLIADRERGKQRIVELKKELLFSNDSRDIAIEALSDHYTKEAVEQKRIAELERVAGELAQACKVLISMCESCHEECEGVEGIRRYWNDEALKELDKARAALAAYEFARAEVGATLDRLTPINDDAVHEIVEHIEYLNETGRTEKVRGGDESVTSDQ